MFTNSLFIQHCEDVASGMSQPRPPSSPLSSSSSLPFPHSPPVFTILYTTHTTYRQTRERERERKKESSTWKTYVCADGGGVPL